MSPSERNLLSGHRAAILMLGFKHLVWLNSLGLLLVLLCALGIIPTDFSPEWLRLPMLAFSCGMLFCGLGLIWAYLLQASLFNQAMAGYVRRTHWVPLFCTVIAYCLSLLAFLAGCWLVMYLAGVSYQPGETEMAGSGNEAMPYSQASRADSFTFRPNQQAG